MRDLWQDTVAAEVQPCGGCDAPTMGELDGRPMCPRCEEEVVALRKMAALEDARDQLRRIRWQYYRARLGAFIAWTCSGGAR